MARVLTDESFFKRGLAIRIFYDGFNKAAFEAWQFREEEKRVPIGSVDSMTEGSYQLAKWADVCRVKA